MTNRTDYTPTTWVSGTTPADAPEMNNIEGGVKTAISRNGDTINSPLQINGTGALLAVWYNIPTGNPTDVPGDILLLELLSSINQTNRSVNGTATNYYGKIIGYIMPTTSETYTFSLTVDDGGRLYIGGTEVIGDSAWKTQGSTTYTGSIALTANKWYPIYLEHFQGGSNEQLHLQWSTPTITIQDIPTTSMKWSMLPLLHASIMESEFVYAHQNMKIKGNQVWHAGNDGAGSGLDADTINTAHIYTGTSDPGGQNGDVWIKA